MRVCEDLPHQLGERVSVAAQGYEVLAAVPSVAAAHRLVDVVECLAGDGAVTVTWTVIPGALEAGVRETLGRHSLSSRRVAEWDVVRATQFDLVLSVGAQHLMQLSDLRGPIFIVPDGPGYDGVSTLVNAGATGLRSEAFVYDGNVVPYRIGVTHSNQAAQLAAACPHVRDRLVVMGDPTVERLLTSRAVSRQFRRVLGVTDSEILVVVCSTWDGDSLVADRLGQIEDLAVRFLPCGRVALVLHPRISSMQPDFVMHHLVPAMRNGLIVIEPHWSWCAALAAADVIVGDHGALTAYGSVLDVPMVVSAVRPDMVGAASPVLRLGEVAPRLNRDEDLAGQVLRAHEEHVPGQYADVAAMVAAQPGRPSDLVRKAVYGALGAVAPREVEVRLVADAPVTVPAHTTALV